jgi:hypothetical protein
MSSFERLAPVQETKAAFVVSPLRGRRYGVDRLYLLPRDPHSAFAAWEVTPALHARAEEIARSRSALVRYALRIERRDREGSSPTMIAAADVPDAVGGEGWYLSHAAAGGECRAVLGLEIGSAFEPLMFSRWVAIPPDGPCRDEGPWNVSPESRAWLARRFALAHPTSDANTPSSAARYLAPAPRPEPRV